MDPRLRRIAAGLLLVLASGLAGARTAPPEVVRSLPDAQLGGNTRLTYLGFKIYDASLWVAPAFTVAQFDRHAFALELSYLRGFNGSAIAQRSIVEMRRQGDLPEADLARWKQQMLQLFPNVRKGDRITGINQPGVGAVFLLNGAPLGTIADEAFARHFFGIWLSEQTSDARLRKALIGQLASR